MTRSREEEEEDRSYPDIEQPADMERRLGSRSRKCKSSIHSEDEAKRVLTRMHAWIGGRQKEGKRGTYLILGFTGFFLFGLQLIALPHLADLM